MPVTTPHCTAHLRVHSACTATCAAAPCAGHLQRQLSVQRHDGAVFARCRIGTTFQGKYSDSIKAAYVYPSSNFLDDLTWAACWLFRKTGEQHFLDVRTCPCNPTPEP